jgi:hypothetical protein
MQVALKDWIAHWIKTQVSTICCLQEIYPHCQSIQTESERMENDISAK